MADYQISSIVLCSAVANSGPQKLLLRCQYRNSLREPRRYLALVWSRLAKKYRSAVIDEM